MGATSTSYTGATGALTRSSEQAAISTKHAPAQASGASFTPASLRARRERRERKPRERKVRIVENLPDVLRIVHAVRAAAGDEDVVVEGARLVLREQAAFERRAGYRLILSPVAVAELGDRERRVGGSACASEQTLRVEPCLDLGHRGLNLRLEPVHI